MEVVSGVSASGSETSVSSSAPLYMTHILLPQISTNIYSAIAYVVYKSEMIDGNIE